MRMMLTPLCPVSSDLGLPTQVQDFLTLLPNLVFTLLQSCFSLECTVTPKGGSTTPLGGGVGGCLGPVLVPGPGGITTGLPVVYVG